MIKIPAYISLTIFCLFLYNGLAQAQSVKEIKFNTLEHPLLTTVNDLVSVSTLISGKQSAADGIHFILVVKNNSSKTISIQNPANKLAIALSNEFGFDISITNLEFHAASNRVDRRWQFRNETISPGNLYINGKEEKTDIKLKEYFEIPGNGISKVMLIIKDVKQVQNTEDLENKHFKPIVNLAPGKYKLQMWLPIISKDISRSGGYIAGYQSPMVVIDYNK